MAFGGELQNIVEGIGQGASGLLREGFRLSQEEEEQTPTGDGLDAARMPTLRIPSQQPQTPQNAPQSRQQPQPDASQPQPDADQPDLNNRMPRLNVPGTDPQSTIQNRDRGSADQYLKTTHHGEQRQVPKAPPAPQVSKTKLPGPLSGSEPVISPLLRVGDPDRFDKDPIINVGVDSHTRMSYYPAKGLSKAMKEAKDAGITIDPFGDLTSYRTFDQQAGLHSSKGKWASPAGDTKATGSLHQFGYAIDVSSDDYDKLDPIMAKYGFARSVEGEPWHYSFQPALPSDDPERVWKDNDPRMLAWSTSLGVGTPGTTDDNITNLAYMRGMGPKATSVMHRLFEQESGKRSKGDDGKIITSPAGAVGIGQMTIPTLQPYLRERGISYEDYVKNEHIQIDIATQHFSGLIESYGGNLAKALAAYNGGTGAVDSAERGGWNMNSSDPSAWSNETLNYVANILDVDKNTAMKWIAAPPGQVPPGAAADIAEDVTDKEYTQYIKNSGYSWLKATLGDSFETQGEPQTLWGDVTQKGQAAVSSSIPAAVAPTTREKGLGEDLKYAVKSMIRSMTASALDALIAANDRPVLPPGKTQEEMPPLFTMFGAPVKYRTEGDPDPNARLKKLSELIGPNEEYHSGVWDQINQDRGADSILSYLGGIPWSRKDGGTDVDMKSIGANAAALGMEMPNFVGSIIGMMIAGPPVTKATKASPMMNAGFELAEEWLKKQATKPNSTAFLSRFFNKATLGASGGIANASKKVVHDMAGDIRNIVSYGAVGIGQAYMDTFGRAYKRGATVEEATAEGLSAAFVGGLLGLALPLGFNRHLAGATGRGLLNAGEGTAAALTGVPVNIPRDYPWKTQAYSSVLDWIRAMEAPGEKGFFTRRINEKMIPYLRLAEANRIATVANKAIDEFEGLASTYNDGANRLQTVVDNQKQYVEQLGARVDQSRSVIQAIEEKQPMLSSQDWVADELGKSLDTADKLRGAVAQVKNMKPEEKQQWAADNADILEAAKAKDIDDFLTPDSKGVSKADKYVTETSKKVNADAAEMGISGGELLAWHRARKDVIEMERRRADAMQNPILKNVRDYEKTIETLRHTANHAKKKADYVRENVDNPLASISKPQELIEAYELSDLVDNLDDTTALLTKLEAFENGLTRAVEEGTHLGFAGDRIAFELTRGTRGIIESLGVDPRQSISVASDNITSSINAVRTDISSILKDIKAARRRVNHLQKSNLPAAQFERWAADYDRLNAKEDGLFQNLENTQLEKEALEKELDSLFKLDPDEPTPENIAIYKEMLKEAKAAERAREKAQAKLESNKKKLEEKIIENYQVGKESAAATKAGDLVEGVKLAELSKDAAKKLKALERHQSRLSTRLGEKVDASQYAQDVIKSAEESIASLQKKAKLQKNIDALGNRASKIEERIEDLIPQREALEETVASGSWRDVDPSVAEEISIVRAREAEYRTSLEAMRELEKQYLKDQEVIGTIQDKVVAHVPSSRHGALEEESLLGTYSNLSSYDAAEQMARQNFNQKQLKANATTGTKSVSTQEINALNPVKAAVKMFDDLSPDERTALVSQELLEAGELYADILEPSRVVQRELGGVPDAMSLRTGDNIAAKDSGVEVWLGKEFMEAVQGVRASDITQEQISSSPLSGFSDQTVRKYPWSKETAEGAANGLKEFVNLDTPSSALEVVNRGINSWKTMVHQLNHSRNVASRVREGWQQVVSQLPEELTVGGSTARKKGATAKPSDSTPVVKSGEKVLRPDIATELIDAIESLPDGSQGLQEFLKKYPTLRKPMQGFISVVNVLEKAKLASPELQATFRDAYIQHIYPRVAEFRRAGYSVDFNQMNTTLGSENRRKMATLVDSRKYYQEGVVTLENAPGWGDRTPNGVSEMEEMFLRAPQSERAQILGYDYDPANSVAVDRKINSVIDKLAMKDPVTDPGEIMEAMVKSTLDTAAQRSALKNIASIPVQNTFDSVNNRPLFGIEHTKGSMVPTVMGADGQLASYQVLSEIEGLGIKPFDDIKFGGHTYKANELAMHPDMVKEFVEKFRVAPQNKTVVGKRWAARSDVHKQARLIGSPLPHAQNIFSGAWQTLITDAVANMWDGAVGMAFGKAHINGRAGARDQFVQATKDLFNSPRDAMGLATWGNKALRGEIPNINPQVFMSDAVLHGVNVNTYNVAMRQGYDNTLNIIKQEDEEIFNEITSPTVSQLATNPDAWAKHVKDESVWGTILRGGDPSNTNLQKAAHGAKTLAGAALKSAVDTDKFLNTYFTYEPMKQAVIGAYHYTAAMHWNKYGQRLLDAGMDASSAMTLVKQEAARYVNSRGGMIQHYLKSNVAGMVKDNHLYGRDAKGENTGVGMLFSSLTPGWLRSKIDFISNGMPASVGGGRRLNDIPNQQYQEWMKKEWRKQLLLGAAATGTAQQLMKWILTGGGIMAAAIAADVGTPEWMSRVRLEVEDPRQWTEMQLSPTVALSSPFQGQMRDVIRLLDGYRRPQALLDGIMNQVNPLGRDLASIVQNTAPGLGSIRIEQTSLDPRAKLDELKAVSKFLGHSGAETISSDILQQETGYTSGRIRKPLGSIAAGLLGFQVRTVNPSNRMSAEVIRYQKQVRDAFERDTITMIKQWESSVNGLSATPDQVAVSASSELLEKAVIHALNDGHKVYGKGLNEEYSLMFPKGRDVMTEAEFTNLFLKTVSPESAALLRENDGFRLAYIKLLEKHQRQQDEGFLPTVIRELQEADKEYDKRRENYRKSNS